ncbi:MULTISPECIES: PhoH family protein [Thermoactinomyces]|uniref:PhoH-like protein n=1 Tax=Thermoactinomyces vulgaris TaxID=2026 RepID=A0ABS0QGI8_THEVU|nr:MULTISPECIES: PhoH family protein [Thermoactinomyces]KYQ86844.1 phosphate starvation-inducible protein PhoH [Thermoactinomyces sp. AS95]MBA4550620.1 PhoH family protein [Thermoactinomyces vulgaris]MBA4596321.1 PhoH family protein [Thermoactinomyces vulgaris]MBH8582948.1 PhoH family protein [Thermoactinomyces sp. CICC 10735]MBH8585738.1 PhoH family protein [Thermoactinomyces sp. CICC 10520]
MQNPREENKTVKIHLRNGAEALSLFGPHDAYLKQIERNTNAQIISRGGEVLIQGRPGDVEILEELFRVLITLIRRGMQVTERDVVYAHRLAEQGMADELLELYQEEIGVTQKGKAIRVKTLGQRHYVTAIQKSDIVFGVGPAGTGKTFLAVVMAVSALKAHRVKRIVLTRPAVEAGENLGFLPGDLQEKVDPYLRPLYDSLYTMLGTEQMNKMMERGLIEVAPLAYMRGRTLEDSFVILDEAQNTTPEQMKMFLTRLGFGSKMVVTGDVTQIDLPRGKKSGLKEAERILKSIPEISFVYLGQADVVRNTLVQKIIDAYEADSKEEENR